MKPEPVPPARAGTSVTAGLRFQRARQVLEQGKVAPEEMGARPFLTAFPTAAKGLPGLSYQQIHPAQSHLSPAPSRVLNAPIKPGQPRFAVILLCKSLIIDNFNAALLQ